MRISYEIFNFLFPEMSLLQGSLDQDLFFSIDSRTVKEDEIFIPFKGQRSDGHSFVESALHRCRGVFVSFSYKNTYEVVIKNKFSDKLIIMVEDPEKVLIELARWWRSQVTCPVVGITGSVGKTSTKLFLENILKYAHKKAFVAQGNQNTVLGISLNIARMDLNIECAIFELGISKPGEMGELVEFVRPTIAVITAIGHSHLEGLGTIADVAHEKKKIFSLFNETNIGIVNGDTLLLGQSSYSHPVVKFGCKKYNQIQARTVAIKDGKLSFVLKLYHNRYPLTFDTTHESYVNIVLAAVTLAYYLGIDEKIIIEAVQQPIERYRRFEKKPLKYPNSFMIDDAYNASPESTRGALLAFDKIPWQGKKIVVLGDMLDLGYKSLFYHRNIGRLFFKLLTIDQLILVGNQVHCIGDVVPKIIPIKKCSTLQEAREMVDLLLTDNTLVLFKASFGMNFIELINYYSTTYKALTLEK